MKTILLPIDLGAASENAFSYAVDYALSQPEKVYLILLYVNTPSQDATIAENAETQKALEQMAAKYLKATGLTYQIVFAKGEVKETIARVAKAHEADFIFMGTKGAKGVKGLLFGSNTSGVIEASVCPVLAIPEKAFFLPYKTIVLASDFAEGDLTEATDIIKLAKSYNGKVVLLHLSKKEDEVLDQQVLEFIKVQLQLNTGYKTIEVAAVTAENFKNDLENELHNLNASLLVMAPRKRAFLQSLTQRSRTKQMVLQTEIPLLALAKQRNAVFKPEPVM